MQTTKGLLSAYPGGPIKAIATLYEVAKRWELSISFHIAKNADVTWTLDVGRYPTAGNPEEVAKGFSVRGNRFFCALTEGVTASFGKREIAKSDFAVEFEAEIGLQTDSSHEYFLSKNGELIGQLILEKERSLGEAVPWIATLIDSKFVPNAVLKNSEMPPDGVSAIPVALEKVIPPPFQYWKMAGEEAKHARDMFVAAPGIESVYMLPVDGQLVVVRQSLETVDEPIEFVIGKGDVSSNWPLTKMAEIRSPSRVCEIFSPTRDEMQKALSVGDVVFFDAGDASDGLLALAMKSLEDFSGHYAITAIDSPLARSQMSAGGRVFKFLPSESVGRDTLNRIFVSSFAVRSDDVQWCSKIDNADPDELRVYTEPSSDKPDLGKSQWSTAFINDLPDGSFMYIEPGGTKDEDGKTKPRSLRHFPYKDANGKIDLPHLRNAVAQAPKSNLPAKVIADVQSHGRKLLETQKSAEFNNPERGGAGDIPPGPGDGELEKKIEHRSDGYHVMSEDGSKHLGGPYGTKGEAVDRLREVEGHKKSDMKTGGPGTLMPAVGDTTYDQNPKIREKFLKSITAKDGDEHYVLGIVLEPNEVDAQKDIYSADEVRDAAHTYMAEYQNRGLMHKELANDRVDLLESYLAPVDFSIGDQVVKAGTWLMAVRVKDQKLWDLVKSGGLTGFSIGGTAQRQPDAKANRKYEARKEAVERKSSFQGIPIHIDRPTGHVQRGVDDAGKEWSREYMNDYGYIPKTKGGDGEGLDVYVGPDGNSPFAYWITQRKADGSFDEYKVVLGVNSAEEAKKIYLQHTPEKYFGGIREGSVAQIKALLNQDHSGESLTKALLEMRA